MGVGGSGPAPHAVEVRLELPEAKCPPGLYFFARLHTAAEGDYVKYKVWGSSQRLRLYPDDIIMVSIHRAKSEGHFDVDNCEDVGELYMPWEVVQKKLIDGEGVLYLGVSKHSKSLGLNASPDDYQESFDRAQQMSQDRMAIAVLVRIRRLPDLQDDGLGRDISPRSQALAPTIRTTPQSSPRKLSPAVIAAPSTMQSQYVPPARQIVASPPVRFTSGTDKASASAEMLSDVPKSPLRPPFRAVSPNQSQLLSNTPSAYATSTSPSMRIVSAPVAWQSALSSPQTAPPAVVRTVGSSVEVPSARSSTPQPQVPLSAPVRQISGGVRREYGSSGVYQPATAPLTEPTPQRPSMPAGVASYGMEELGADDMRVLRQIQVQNLRLRQQLGMREDEELPEVDEMMRGHINRLQEEVTQYFSLMEKLQKADKDLATLNASLSKEERLALSGFAAPPSVDMIVEDEADVRRRIEGMMGEIQEVTQTNIKLIKEYDEAIKHLEWDLSSARRQKQRLQGQASSPTQHADNDSDELYQSTQELEALKSECQQLQDSISMESERKKEADFRTIQKLQTEKEVLMEEIENLRESLQKDVEEPNDEPTLPATGILSAEADKLMSQLAQEKSRGQQEQEHLNMQIEELRKQTKGFEEELQHVEEEKQRVHNELQELRLNRDGAKAIERDRLELEQAKEDIANASNRCQSMIQAYDEKIDALQQETDDIRRRVEGVSRGGNLLSK